MLDAHQLNVFLKASETLNFTQAAKRLNLTQPSVSQHIQSLENHFNMKLFLRTGKGLQLTEAGMALVPLAREMINHSIRINESMASLQGEVFGNLQVGCSTTPGKYILPKLLAKFHHRYPRVKVSCNVTPQLKAMEMLHAGEIHFALAGVARTSVHGIELHKFFCDQVLLIAPQEHPWAQRRAIPVSDLGKGKFILREESSGTYQTTKDTLRENGVRIEDLPALMTLGNSEAIALAVKEGLGVGFVSQSVVAGIGRTGLAVIDIEGVEIQRDIYIARQEKRLISKAQDVFWDFITSNKNQISDMLVNNHHSAIKIGDRKDVVQP